VDLALVDVRPVRRAEVLDGQLATGTGGEARVAPRDLFSGDHEIAAGVTPGNDAEGRRVEGRAGASAHPNRQPHGLLPPPPPPCRGRFYGLTSDLNSRSRQVRCVDSPRRLMWLRVLTGTRTGKLVEIRGASFVVGRDRSCNFVVRDAGVARRHAVFRAERGGGWLLEDLGSAEGTFVATRRISRPVKLEGNEELSFGPVVVRLVPAGPGARERRPGVLIAVAALVLVAVVGAVAGVLATQVGSDETAAAPSVPAVVPALPSAQTGVSPDVTEPAVQQGATTASDTARRVVLREDFSNPDTGWEVFSQNGASAKYAAGALQIDVTNPAFYATAVSGRSYDRPIVTVTAENPQRSSFSAFGVVCRYRGQDDFYLLAAGTDGTVAMLRREGGRLRPLTPGWVRTHAVPIAAPVYRLRAECLQRRLRLLVDGREVLSLDRAGGPGDVGVFAAGRVEFRFDNVTVTDAD